MKIRKNDYYIDTKTDRSVSGYTVVEQIKRGVSKRRYVPAYPANPGEQRLLDSYLKEKK